MTSTDTPKYGSSSDWTPIPNQVFENVLGELEGTYSAAIYLWLYDQAYHRRSRSLPGTIANIADAMQIDARSAKKCLLELHRKELINRVKKGIKRSKTRKPVWEVPAAALNLSAGSWTPLPSIIATEYVPAFPNAVLLALLIYYQNIKRMDFCWAGVETLSNKLNWSKTRVRQTLRDMYEPERWRKCCPNLPRPLECTVVNQNGKPRRHYSVRVITYDRSQKKPVMRVSPTFRRKFELL